MAFTEKDKLKALAVVNIFETGKSFGDYSAVAVLDDGAGISYGISQFTHKSGALAAVIERYLELGGVVGKRVIGLRSELLKKRTSVAVKALADDEEFKKVLKAAALTSEMQEAQMLVMFERYLKPALDVCSEKSFVLPLSLAVVYDSFTHGSWKKISEKVRDRASEPTLDDSPERQSLSAHQAAKPQSEKEWISEYVRVRDKWLASVPRLKKTRYRTQFFLKQIAIGHWDLELPLNVNGLVLTEAALRREPMQGKLFDFEPEEPPRLRKPQTPLLSKKGSFDILNRAIIKDAYGPSEERTTTPVESLPETLPGTFPKTDRPQTRAVPAEPRAIGSGSGQEEEPVGGSSGSRQEETDGESCLDKAEEVVSAAAAKYDQAERIVNTVITRKDAAKSLWTTVVGTILQTAWSIAAFLSDTPRAVWLVVAVVAGALTLAYLYRQSVFKRVRENSQEDKNEN